jgi:hypothetical protein
MNSLANVVNLRTLLHRIALGALIVACSAVATAQVKAIPEGGLEGLTAEDLNFEPEYRDRSARQAGMATPAPEGTKPGSTDPRDLNGIWVNGKTFAVDVEATASTASTAAAPNAASRPRAGSDTFEGVVGVGLRQETMNICRPRQAFTIGLPGKIIQTPKMIYILRNSLDGTSYRRIDMSTREHPVQLVPSTVGHAIAHWDGDTLVVETVGLKGAMSAGESFGLMGAGATFSNASKVTERIRKTDGNLRLEDMVTIEDPALAKPYSARIVSYWRPDLKFVEAPCEEWSDPLVTEIEGPFKGGDEPRPTRY